MAAAAGQQHGRVVERIAVRQLGDDVALGLERLRAAEHGRVQRAHAAAPRASARDQLCDRRVDRRSAARRAARSASRRALRMHGMNGRAAWRPRRRSAARRRLSGGIRLGQHDGGRLCLGRDGLRAVPRTPRRSGSAAPAAKASRQPSAGLSATTRIGPCSDMGRYAATRTAEDRECYASAINAASTRRALTPVTAARERHATSKRIDAKRGQRRRAASRPRRRPRGGARRACRAAPRATRRLARRRPDPRRSRSTKR